jgi:hypothetical protein
MASFHRIGDLVLPLGRPGPGPEKVRYEFILDSGTATAPAPPAAPVRAQPWAVLLVLAALAFGGVTAYWAWSRH